jgi:hypothetical protein
MGRYRLNADDPADVIFSELDYTNQFLIATTENHWVSIGFDERKIWRIMLEVKTSSGSLTIKVPVLNKNIQELIYSCKYKG